MWFEIVESHSGSSIFGEEMSKKSNCYNCEKRYVGCHSKCEGYLEEKKKRDEENEKKKKIKDNRFYIDHLYHNAK